VETKTDDMDEIKLPGYKFHMKNRKTNSRVKSGGIIIERQEKCNRFIYINNNMITIYRRVIRI
jgi:hypothetical protein